LWWPTAQLVQGWIAFPWPDSVRAMKGLNADRQTDRQMDGRTDGRMDGWM